MTIPDPLHPEDDKEYMNQAKKVEEESQALRITENDSKFTLIE